MKVGAAAQQQCRQCEELLGCWEAFRQSRAASTAALESLRASPPSTEPGEMRCTQTQVLLQVNWLWTALLLVMSGRVNIAQRHRCDAIKAEKQDSARSKGRSSKATQHCRVDTAGQ